MIDIKNTPFHFDIFSFNLFRKLPCSKNTKMSKLKVTSHKVEKNGKQKAKKEK